MVVKGVEGGLITVDISLHELVPKHEILTKLDKKELLERLGVNEKQLPVILLLDPALEGMDAKPGDVVKITRKSQTAGYSNYYRIVTAK
jgi:DNA-directed RNA polymerase subunit H